MKYNVMFLVTRLNGKVTNVIPIEEVYTCCQVYMSSKNLTDDDISKFYNNMSDDYKIEQLNYIRKNGHLYEEGEAKDLTCKLSKYSISIEHKEIDFNDEEQSDVAEN